MQIDARRDGLDRRHVDMIVSVREDLIGKRHGHAASAALGIDVARHVGAGAQLARDTWPALAFLFLRWLRLSDVGLLPLGGWQRRVRRRLGRGLGRLSGAGLEFGNARQELLDLLDQLAVLREQPEHQRLQAVLVERIECLGRHPELESDPDDPLNARSPSQTVAWG